MWIEAPNQALKRLQMQIWNSHPYSVFLLNFDPKHTQIAEGAIAVLNLTAAKFGFPSLRSKEIYLFENLHDATPRYLTSTATEFISFNIDGYFPIRFVYQFAHEMGHLMSQAWQRHRQPSHYSWIEEALCGAFSIYCIRQLAGVPSPWFQDASEHCLRTYIDVHYPPIPIDHAWYIANQLHLAASDTLTPTIKLLSRMIADAMPSGMFVEDNKALVGIQSDPDVAQYLCTWETRCARATSVPKLFKHYLQL